MKCPSCGLLNPDAALRCDCGYDFPSGQVNEPYAAPDRKWYQTKAVVILLLWFLYPVGLYALWKHGEWSRRAKWTVTVCSMILYVFFFFVASAPESAKDGPTESNLASLLKLSIYTASRDPELSPAPKEAALRCVEVTRQARAYCSRLIVRDLTRENLKPGDYSIQWRVDFVQPARYHVTQSAWDDELGELFDEWVSIGKEHYQNAGLWIQVDDEESMNQTNALNRSLSVETWLDILRYDDPVSSHVYRYRQSRYLLLEYKAPKSSESSRGYFEVCAWLLNSRCEMRIWVDLDKSLLAKGELVFEGQSPEGEHVHGEVQQVFTSYNENVQVRPPSWLNAVRDAEGKLVIVETKVEILPHHP